MSCHLQLVCVCTDEDQHPLMLISQNSRCGTLCVFPDKAKERIHMTECPAADTQNRQVVDYKENTKCVLSY